jgi:protein-S-isoprenylcysteine O-methyltransferase Ste14
VACRRPSPLHATLYSLVAILVLHLVAGGPNLLAWPLNLVGVGMMVFAVWFAARAEREFRDHATTVRPGIPARALVTTGPFRYSRHPMYLALVLAAAGGALGLGSPTPWLPVAALALTLDRCARAEEDALAQQFGAAYGAYRAQVRRWL